MGFLLSWIPRKLKHGFLEALFFLGFCLFVWIGVFLFGFFFVVFLCEGDF